MAMDLDLANKTLAELEQIAEKLGQKKYVAKYIFSFIHSKNTLDISQITPLSKALRDQLLKQGYYISSLKTLRKLTDSDGTIKYLFELPDKKTIETVLLFDDKRRTLCVSTQVGCAMGCTFCATAKIKLKRDLTAAEIAAQVNAVQNDKYKITNIVYMGMGEPMLNYDNVLRSIRILNHPAGKNFAIRHLAISTCGIVPAINRLANEDIFPRLAVSLNAPTDSLRSKLMGINKKFPLRPLLKAIQLYQLKTKHRVTFEYILIKDVNDSTADAHALVKLIRNIRCNVNLIGYNPHPGCKFTSSDKRTIGKFREILDKNKIETAVRLKRGLQIKAACGQLGADWKNR